LLSGSGPRIDWAEAVKNVKQHCNEIKVVVLAPYEQDAATALEAGASAQLLKEIEVSVLADAIRSVVSKQ
jgi:DNA-binding NarL/FixJ family response regulator